MLVLSLFPGVGLLDMAFETEGFCVVRGPDLLWGGDVRRFHPPAGRFDLVIGGPPCKGDSNLAHLNGTPGENLRGEYMRVVREARPSIGYVLEGVDRFWDLPLLLGTVRLDEYEHLLPSHAVALSPRWLGEEQSRKRWFHSNLNLAPHIDVATFESIVFKHAVLAGHGPGVGKVVRGIAKYPWPEACRLQGLPETFDLPGFTRQAAYEAIGNGVPLVMGRAVACAVKRALSAQSEAA